TQASEILGVSPSHVRWLARKGKIRTWRVGRALRYYKPHVLRLQMGLTGVPAKMVMKRLRIGPKRLEKLVAAGKLHPMPGRLPGERRFSAEEVERLAQALEAERPARPDVAEEDGLTVPQVAEVLSLSRGRVYNLAKKGKIRTWRVGQALRYYKPDVLQLQMGLAGVPAKMVMSCLKIGPARFEKLVAAGKLHPMPGRLPGERRFSAEEVERLAQALEAERAARRDPSATAG
ncbi:MAG: helix-turn-helix domain-containing protein, partial [Deltaproteobacteria bacterium]|nr:helix-turn-helix domain-containing protein [Deltaproteobacteria bacterium]